MAVTGECALCKKESELKLSHIIPKFVFRNFKKDSFTGRFRTASEPNRPLQDGKKEYLLCGECEGLFNSDETRFSNKIFIPFKESGFKSLIKYDGNWLSRFITSVNWRVLYLDIKKIENEQDHETQLTPDILNVLTNAEEIMRLYLLNKRLNLGDLENHIFFFDEVESKSGIENPYALFHGTVFASTVIRIHDKTDVMYVVSNLLGALIVTIIKKHPNERWRNTFVKNESGKIKPPQTLDSPVAAELIKVQELREKYKKGLSPRQREQIQEKIEKNPEGFMNSGTFKRIMLDRNLN
ncbi:hypothetical protein [Bacillus cereus group sp. N21]|uniref:hypothetical protein n=1 Tax=Bacillus cereus group sp. N21 TaxID=2794591 RepID=UPI0018F7022F|nr:hypothetical protein [Bacillus cereus group sp. N21]MBJ8031069.1 hypothetical protein [Bacillus cereus group sp. N21]